jgi:predicted dehydrogenase
MSIKVVILGAGAMAQEHCRVFQAIEGVELVGIHSRTRSKADALAEAFGIGCISDSLDSLYDMTGADLAVVAVSDEASCDVGLACMEFDWTLLMEKPPGITPDQTAQLVDAAQTRQRRVYVGLNRRYYSVTQVALQDLNERDGRRYIVVQDQQNMQAMRSAGFPEIVVANWMYKNSIHLIDYLRVFGRGEITQVTPLVPWQGETTDLVLVRVDFSSGDMGLYEGVWIGPGPWAVNINTPERRWELRPLEQGYYQNAGERQHHAIEISAWDQKYKAGFRLQAEEVIRALHNEPSQAATITDAYETMQLVERVFSLTGLNRDG